MAIDTFVTLEEVRAHLRLLATFSDLRKAQGGDKEWAAYVGGAVQKFHTLLKSFEGQSDGEVEKRVEGADSDVLLVWHTYLLNPMKYQEACQKGSSSLSKLGPFPLLSAELQTEGASKATTYSYLQTESKHGFDLASAVLRQSSFIQKIDGYGWTELLSDDQILESIERYRAFLSLISSGAVTCLVPTLDIDLVWHTHQLKGDQYCDYTRQLVGYVIDHNDDLPDEKLAVDFSATERAWKTVTGEPYVKILGEVANSGRGCNGSCGSCGASLIEEGYLRDEKAGCGSACNGIGNCGGCIFVVSRCQAKTNLVSRCQAKTNLVSRCQAGADLVSRCQAGTNLVSRCQAETNYRGGEDMF